MAKLFGTDGMRGEAGRFPLDAETVCATGRSLTRHLAERLGRAPQIIVGRDTRESGAWIASALISGAQQAGARCSSAGVMTTPGVAFLTQHLQADAGVVISASHNPFSDNGIKIFAPTGQKLDERLERLIEEDIFAERAASEVEDHSGEARHSSFTAGPVETPARSIEDSNLVREMRELYLQHLASKADGLRLDGLKVVIDCANGAASEIAPEFFARLGARVAPIHNRPDGRNINRDCGSLHLDSLRRTVLEQGADVGVAFDGDADRALFIDERGETVDGDAVLWIMAQRMQERGELYANTVVATVMSNMGLEVALRERGIKLLRTPVGDKYVLDELIRTGATLGGEQSGHIIFPRLSLAGDGLLTALQVFRAMREAAKGLSELAAGFAPFPQVLVNVRVREKVPFDEVAAIKACADEIERALDGQGRLLLRYSGTEPLARIMIEGRDRSMIEALVSQLASVIERELG
jgi:phosphoglucosamine mutase